jgi:hypothetical protein
MGRVADRRRERLRKDTRPDWRDPNMPVVREYKIENEYGQVIERGVELASPEEVQAEAREALKASRKDPSLPSYHNDASYYWADIAKYVKDNPDDGD